MQMNNQLSTLLQRGMVDGFSSTPTVIETVISRVFIFDTENRVLKFYKRDNEWWNTDMKDLSGGNSRIDFIRNDFEFNHFLNPTVYIDLKQAIAEDGKVKLVNPKSGDDELVIIMHKEDIQGTLTEVLYQNTLSVAEYRSMGEAFAKIKLALPEKFLPATEANWYELMCERVKDVKTWALSEKDFPKDLADKALAILSRELEENKNNFRLITKDSLFVSIDCNSENLIYTNHKLRFLDAYPPKDDWRISAFNVDIFRVGYDIYTFAGKESYDAFLEGVRTVAGDRLDRSTSHFYLLYAGLIVTPYFYMLDKSKKDQKYLVRAEKSISLLKELLQRA